MSKRKVTNYNEEFKRSSAKLAVNTDRTLQEIANDLGVHVTTLYGWVKKYYPSGKKISKASCDDLEAENKQLRKELAKVKEERDILKKAAAYFASQEK
jgi:transposase-like protein